jgi:hypothetical protein
MFHNPCREKLPFPRFTFFKRIRVRLLIPIPIAEYCSNLSVNCTTPPSILPFRRPGKTRVETSDRNSNAIWNPVAADTCELRGVSGRESIILNDEKETLSRSERIESTWRSGRRWSGFRRQHFLNQDCKKKAAKLPNHTTLPVLHYKHYVTLLNHVGNLQLRQRLVEPTWHPCSGGSPLSVSETTSARNVPNNAGAPLAYSIWYGLVRPVIHAFDDSPNAPPTLEPVA